MSKSLSWLAALAMASLLGSAHAFAADYKYTGVKDCGRCHKKELIGNQLAAWEKMDHAKAFETLKGEEAKKIAADRGMTEAPHESGDCLRCHATAYGLEPDQIHKKPLKLTDGVQCESCHGPGSAYRKKKVMSDREQAIAAGMWEPGKDEKICTTCHNSDSPTFDAAGGFDYAKRKEKIAHPIPEHVKGRYIEAEKEERAKRKAGGE